MAEECTEQVLSLGYSKVMLGLGISVRGSSFPSECTLLCSNICISGSVWLDIDIGQTVIVTCDDSLSEFWKVTYTEYMSEYAVRVKVCRVTEDEEEDEDPIPDEAEVDYGRIESITADIVDDAETSIKAEISEAAGAVAGVAAALDTVYSALAGQIASLTSYTEGLIDDVSQGLHDQIGGVLEAVTGGISGLSDKLDGMEFPTPESIKQAFLDTCGDLALALWDAILDRIEERYPDDKEESD